MENKPKMIEHRLYVRKADTKEINLDFKPGFFDALQLLKPYPSAHFCQILLDPNTSHRIYSKTYQTDIQLQQYEDDSGGQPKLIRENNGIHACLLSSLLIKTSPNKVSFAIQMPENRVKNKIKDPLPSLAEYKRQKRTL
ncbi:hypothetical protein KZX50_14470 [Bacillus infantis]|uniref:hypothetical protein n=1 Tax=Bacillus infantis TaxID=324767 RepID=UPI000B9C7051|nr:hypothetical protein [Bacillus infantis]MCK6206646.1 hypothetical protein [Bacillus infantis]OXT16070.1 hypothetical protein B9K06_18035 [Bacillus sp. OG2]